MRDTKHFVISGLVAAMVLFASTGFSTEVYNTHSSSSDDAITILTDIRQTEDKILKVNTTIGYLDVRYYEHRVDNFTVKNDSILLHITRDTGDVTTYEKQWRDIDALTMLGEINDLDPEKPYYWKQKVIFVKETDCGYFYSFDKEQHFPVIGWEVRYHDGTTVLYNLDGEAVGNGIPAPAETGFSINGYDEEVGPDCWKRYRESADKWFNKWCNTTVSLASPTPRVISSFIQNESVEYFFELAHGSSKKFQADKEGSYYTTSMAHNDMSTRDPIKFAFIGSCDGMKERGPMTFSYEFRKGEIEDTVTIGYTGMSGSPGWAYSYPWQEHLFKKMDMAYTVNESFYSASAKYPVIADNIVFAGDTDFGVKNIYADAGGSYRCHTYENITFDGSKSRCADGNIVSYIWDFGDGKNDSGVTPTHRYTEPDTYTVTLTIEDNNGNRDSDTTRAFVGPADIVGKLDGGFRISTFVLNNGDKKIIDVPWSIQLEGTLWKGEKTTGKLTIPPKVQVQIKSNPIFGFGPATITVTVATEVLSANCKILGPLVYDVKQSIS